MINKRTILITAIASFLLLIFSCNVSVNSMYYKQQMNRMHGQTDPDNDGGGTELPEVDENAIQELFDKAEIEKDNIFPASNFDNWVFYMTDIDSDNVCTYKFGEGTWVDQGDYEVYSDGPDIGGNQINAAWDLEYYRYKTRADRWKAEGEQHFDPELDDVMSQREARFYFFKFTGSASAGTELDNSMLCVDTYTKFVFNYSEPGHIKEIFGNKVPTKWQDWADPNTTVGNNHTEAYTTPFYLYDPVGYVEANGDVVYYDWANNKIRNTNYSPSRNSGFTAVAERAQDKPGRSPYLAAGNTLFIKAKSIKNVSIGGQDKSWLGSIFENTYDVERGIFNYTLKALSTVSVDLDEKNETLLSKDEEKIFDEPQETAVENPAEDIILSLTLSKHDMGWNGIYEGYLTLSTEINECSICTEDTPISLNYNIVEKSFGNPYIDGSSLPEGVSCSVPSDFSIQRGEIKQLPITFTVNRSDLFCEGDVVITYELNWQ